MPRRFLYVDAEDPAHANWTRFLNHAHSEPNLSSQKAVSNEGVPSVRFITQKQVQQGEELLFHYGSGFDEWLKLHTTVLW